MTSLEARYTDRLRNFPQPGGGRHTALLAVANLGILAGIAPEQIHADIRQAVSGARSFPDREIQSAVIKAAAEHQARPHHYRVLLKPQPVVRSGQTALRRIIEQGTISHDADLWEASPIRLLDAPGQDMVLVLSTLFAPNELVFIGDRLEPGLPGKNIRTAADWSAFFRDGGKAGPFIIVNPLTGKPAPKKDGSGEMKFRGNNNVHGFRHCLVEFDTLNRETQIRFWSAAKLPIVALIDTGGKSIHAWLEVEGVSTAGQWEQHIQREFYATVLAPIGVDRACSNAARLSRLPGVFRSESGRFQRILWLSATGRQVAP